MNNEKINMRTLTNMLGEIEYVDVPLSGGIFEGKDITLHVRRTLTFKDAMQFVADVAGSCADMEDASYMPSAFDFAMKLNTVACYAEIPVGKTEMAKMYRLIYETDIFHRVAGVICREQHEALVNAALNHVEYLRDMMTSTASGKVMEMLAAMGGFADSMQDFTKQVESEQFQTAMKKFTTAPETEETGKVLLMKKRDADGDKE